MGNTVKNILKKNYEKGVSLLEALISTAIVGIGFIAVFQIVNYSTSSVNVSAERTKMNYIVSMVAEDLIGYNSSLVDVNPHTTTVQLDEHRRPVENGEISSVKKFPQKFIDDPFKVDIGNGFYLATLKCIFKSTPANKKLAAINYNRAHCDYFIKNTKEYFNKIIILLDENFGVIVKSHDVLIAE